MRNLEWILSAAAGLLILGITHTLHHSQVLPMCLSNGVINAYIRVHEHRHSTHEF